MTIELLPPSPADRELLRRMMQLYLYDFTEFEDDDLDEHGLFRFDHLDEFWNHPEHIALLVKVDGKLAGFVLVDDYVVLPGSQRSIAEFFVLRKYRRQGVGKYAAQYAFSQFPARWEVRVVEGNTPAQNFWRTTISEYTHGDFQQTDLNNSQWTGPIFTFDNRPDSV